MTHYLSRLTLNSDPSAKALMPLLNPNDPVKAADAHHRLVWSVFSDSPSRKRDFLWRYNGNGQFMILSARPPNENALFLPPEIKAFDPNLHKGDRLNYILRANATKKRITGKGNGQRVDVVMNMLYQVPIKKRADERQLLAAKAAETWMINQGATKGYRSLKTVTQGYSTLELGRKRGQGATFGILDLSWRD